MNTFVGSRVNKSSDIDIDMCEVLLLGSSFTPGNLVVADPVLHEMLLPSHREYQASV